MKVFARLVALSLGVMLLLTLNKCGTHHGIDSPHKPTEEEYWKFWASVNPWNLENAAEIDVTQIEFLIYAEDETESRETGKPVVGELSFSAFVQRSESTSDGVPMGEIIFRRPTKNFFLAVNEASLPDGIEIDCDGLQYIEWDLKGVGYTLSEK